MTKRDVHRLTHENGRLRTEMDQLWRDAVRGSVLLTLLETIIQSHEHCQCELADDIAAVIVTARRSHD